MKIAIIDADLIGRKKHRFPNLACEKISGYWKSKNADVVLKTDYSNLEEFDKVFISKVFTDTEIPEEILDLPNVEYGGTGFFFDEAPNLPDEIEHSFPDYNLYNEWINEKIVNGVKKTEFKEYTDCSIGFMTRGCFRKCQFCVNRKYNHVFKHSPLEEFLDINRKKICLLDDNFLGCPNWKEMLQQLIDTGKPFKFKQGLDERLLTEEKCKMLFSANYDGRYIFAFDNINDYDLIESKLQMIRKYSNKRCMFYVLCGFDKTGKYNDEFWEKDINDTFKRIELLIKYKCLPYIMRYQNKKESPWESSENRGMYINLARWCNQPSLFHRNSLLDFCNLPDCKGKAPERYLNDFLNRYPKFDRHYLNMVGEY